MNTRGLLLAVALGVATDALGADYPIQIHRPASAGQAFDLSCQIQVTIRATTILATSLGIRTAPEVKTNFVAALDSLVKVLEVDAKGKIAKASCTISNCVSIEGKYKRELLPAGTVVTASAENGKPQFLAQGNPLAGDAQKVLTMAIGLDPGGSTGDEIFGTETPRKIGESWEINPEHAASMLGAQGLQIAKEDIQGRATLEQLVRVGDVECLKIAAKVYLKKFAPAVPPGAQVKLAFGAFRSSWTLPLNSSLGTLEESEEMTADFTIQSKPSTNSIAFTAKSSTVVKRDIQKRYRK